MDRQYFENGVTIHTMFDLVRRNSLVILTITSIFILVSGLLTIGINSTRNNSNFIVSSEIEVESRKIDDFLLSFISNFIISEEIISQIEETTRIPINNYTFNTIENRKDGTILLQVVGPNLNEINILVDSIYKNSKSFISNSSSNVVLNKIGLGESEIISNLDSIILYSLIVNIEVSYSNPSIDDINLIISYIEHLSSIDKIKNSLSIIDDRYFVSAEKNEDSKIEVKLSGPNKENVEKMLIELIESKKVSVQNILNYNLISSGEIDLQVSTYATDSLYQIVRNSVLGMLIGIIVSLIYIFMVRFMSQNAIADNDLEILFQSQVIGNFKRKGEGKRFLSIIEVKK